MAVITRAMARRTKRIRAKPAYAQYVALYGFENHERARGDAHHNMLFNKNRAAATLHPLKRRHRNASPEDMSYWNLAHSFHIMDPMGAPAPVTVDDKNAHYSNAHAHLVKDVHFKKNTLKKYRQWVTRDKLAVKAAEDHMVSNIAQLVELSQFKAVTGH